MEQKKQTKFIPGTKIPEMSVSTTADLVEEDPVVEVIKALDQACKEITKLKSDIETLGSEIKSLKNEVSANPLHYEPQISAPPLELNSITATQTTAEQLKNQPSSATENSNSNNDKISALFADGLKTNIGF